MVLMSMIYSSAVKVILIWLKYKKLVSWITSFLVSRSIVYLISKSVYTLMILFIFTDSLISSDWMVISVMRMDS